MINNLSEEIKNRLIDSTAGILSAEEFNMLYTAIYKQFEYFPTINALNNFFRVLNSLFDKYNFIRNSIKYDFYIKSLFLVTSYSNYLTDILVRNPELIHVILDDNFINIKLSKKFLKKELLQNAANYKSFNSKINYIKLFKRKYTLIIAFNDISGNYSLLKTTLYLSNLAKVISEFVLKLIINNSLEKFSITKLTRKFALISLGKLGGNELNYSSDIDLIFIYDKNIKINKNCTIMADIFFNNVLSAFIKTMTELTDKGYIYRVDFRLRPDGKNSLLANTLKSYMTYYELRGEEWEKQMLLKLNFVSGNKALFNKFKNFIIPYVFSLNISSSPLERIKSLKKKIEYDKDDNIKLCKGGIRDIEFSIQALQLIYGNKYKNLFDGNTLSVLKKLYKNKLISTSEFKDISTAYIFYRKIEHFLQLMNDRQTHLIPYNSAIFESLLYCFNFKDKEEFIKSLNNYKALVRAFFNSVFNESDNQQISSNDSLQSISFADPQRARKNYNFIKNGTDLLNISSFDKNTSDLFNKFEHNLLEILKNSPFPDIVLDNFSKGIRSVYFPSIWYNSFNNTQQLKAFCDLCLFSDRAFILWIEDKKVSDILLTGRVFINNFLDSAWHRPVNHLIFSLSIQYALKIINEAEFGDFFTKLIENKINSLYQKLKITCFSVFGFGSFGTKSMNFASDIDLMFITENKSDYNKIYKTATNFIELLNKELFPLKFDFRLRPEGKSSQIVWEFNSLKNYLNTRAVVWELQAMQKIKFIAGDYNLFIKIAEEYISVVKKIDLNKAKYAIAEMRRKILKNNLSTYTNIKYSPGALQDIDFLIQFAFFIKPNLEFLINSPSFIERFTLLNELLLPQEIEQLLSNYYFLKQIEISNQNIFGVNNSNISTENNKLKRLILFLQIQDINYFLSKINNSLLFNNSIYNKYLGS